MDIKWVHEGVVQIGHYCTAQGELHDTLCLMQLLNRTKLGTIQQIGETAVAFATGVSNASIILFIIVGVDVNQRLLQYILALWYGRGKEPTISRSHAALSHSHGCSSSSTSQSKPQRNITTTIPIL